VIQLRGVEFNDLDALFAIDRECFQPGIAYSRTDLRYYLSHPGSVSILAEDGETKAVLGFVIARHYLEKGLPVGHLITIDVRSAARRQGLGRMMMEAILARLSAAEVTRVKLEVATGNSVALDFYRRLGFSRTGRIPGYYMGKLDALVMEKNLDPNGATQAL
jgi:[ribosomal protein S18]-alanine N-acetyltransferase